jgi:hypothetical protein
MSEQSIRKFPALILDSGAFSAWTKKAEIGVDNYCDWVLRYIDYIDYVVNLDVIPGSFGQKRLPPSVVEGSAKQGWDNYKYMLERGVPKSKLIHVFHQGESFKWLEKMVESMHYIGLSPANDRTTKEKMQWLDDCMNYVIGEDGLPLVKFHGFAVTSHTIMTRYPWYSVDSASWVMSSRVGSVIVPKFDDRKDCYDYLAKPLTVSVSSRSPNKSEYGKHFSHFSPLVKRKIIEYIEFKGYLIGESHFKKVSKDYELKDNERWWGKAYGDWRDVEEIVSRGVSNDYILRDEINMLYFIDLQRMMPKWPWVYKRKYQKGFFDL